MDVYNSLVYTTEYLHCACILKQQPIRDTHNTIQGRFIAHPPLQKENVQVTHSFSDYKAAMAWHLHFSQCRLSRWWPNQASTSH